MTVHRPRVMRVVPQPDDLYRNDRYRAGCTCGTSGPLRVARPDAEADLQEHLEAVAAPPERRCRKADPRGHGVAWWESCPLCDGSQPVLAGLDVGGER